MKWNHLWQWFLGTATLLCLAAGTAMAYQPDQRAERAYERAMSALDRQDYEESLTLLNNVVEGGGARADAALYWLAYTQNRLGQRNEALSTVAALKQKYPNSRWVNDANALELEVRQAAGQEVSPDAQTDDEMKLLALSALMRSDAERVLPIIEKILSGADSPKVKERALFVLSQSNSAEAKEILTRIAKGGGNPEVQRTAIRQLGIRGGDEAARLLGEVYATQSDTSLKREVIRAYMILGDATRLAELAKAENDPSLRREAIRMLGATKDEKLLGEMYAAERDPLVRTEILNALMVTGASQRLVEIANNESDEAMRTKAIQLLGVMGRGRTGDELVGLYSKWDSESAKKAVIQALMVQGNAQALVNIARKETDAALKLEAVRHLSHMNDKVATDYVLEILEQ